MGVFCCVFWGTYGRSGRIAGRIAAGLLAWAFEPHTLQRPSLPNADAHVEAIDPGDHGTP